MEKKYSFISAQRSHESYPTYTDRIVKAENGNFAYLSPSPLFGNNNSCLCYFSSPEKEAKDA
jgi:hypothetical protein